MSALSLYAELLAYPGVLSAEHRSYADEIKTLANRSHTLIERLAGYRRVYACEPETTALPSLLSDYSGLLKKVVGRPIEISIGPFADQAIMVSSEAVERVLLNLTKNAATATHPSGRISVSVEGSRSRDEYGRGHVVLTVTDDGLGMSRETLRNVVQAAPISNREGRGLGLQIVRELVAKSGGLLAIQSYPGRGTTVSVKWFTARVEAA
ncbi:ATP-binding protein [Edaphobacter sp. HDX4]